MALNPHRFFTRRSPSPDQNPKSDRLLGTAVEHAELLLVACAELLDERGDSVRYGVYDRQDSFDCRVGHLVPEEVAVLDDADDAVFRSEGRLGLDLASERDWPEIRAAVEAYLRHSGNAIAAGAELGIHRHTVRARVRRYEAISGLCLDEPDSRLVVALAFRLAKLLPYS
jgi:hypothetical protein